MGDIYKFLSLKTKKTQAIVFGSPHTLNLLKKLNIPDIKINSKDEFVPFVNEGTRFGVILDSTLFPIPQVQQVMVRTKKVNRALYGFKVTRPCTSLSVHRRLIE